MNTKNKALPKGISNNFIIRKTSWYDAMVTLNFMRSHNINMCFTHLQKNMEKIQSISRLLDCKWKQQLCHTHLTKLINTMFTCHFKSVLARHWGYVFMGIFQIFKKPHYFMINTKIVQRKSGYFIIDIRPPIRFRKSVGPINNGPLLP